MFNLFVIRPYGYNIGNHVIFSALKNLIKNNFHEDLNIISIPASSKYDSNGNSGLTSSSIHEINQYGHGVIIGGGNLLENGELDIHPEALKALRPPLMLFSLSWGRIYDSRGDLNLRTDSISEKNLETLLNLSKVNVARDLTTKSYLESISKSKISLGGCPTLFFNQEIQQSKFDGIKENKVALVSIRNPSLMSITPNHQSRIKPHIKKMCMHLKDLGYKPILLCHDHRDISFASSFEKLNYLYSENVEEYLNILKFSSLLITYRVHSFLPAIGFKIPSINIEYDERSSSLVKTVGLEKLSISLFNAVGSFSEQLTNKLSFVNNSFIDYLANTDDIREILKDNQIKSLKNFIDYVYEYKKGLYRYLD